MLSVAALDEATVAELKDLVRINTDSARGFRKTAREIQNKRIAAFLTRNAEERQRFAVELRTLLRMSEEDAEDIGSVRGAVHRWWIGLRGLIAGGNERAVLAEAERGEQAIGARYEDALERAGDNPVFETLTAHYRSIVETQDRVRELRARTG
jgi:uncharacterized protein (TIGR02284 family)